MSQQSSLLSFFGSSRAKSTASPAPPGSPPGSPAGSAVKKRSLGSPIREASSASSENEDRPLKRAKPEPTADRGPLSQPAAGSAAPQKENSDASEFRAEPAAEPAPEPTTSAFMSLFRPAGIAAGSAGSAKSEVGSAETASAKSEATPAALAFSFMMGGSGEAAAAGTAASSAGPGRRSGKTVGKPLALPTGPEAAWLADMQSSQLSRSDPLHARHADTWPPSWTAYLAAHDEATAGGRPPPPLPYNVLVDTLARIEATTKRLEIQAHLTLLFRFVLRYHPGDLLMVLYLCLNRVTPDYEGVELGIGEALLVKSMSQSTGLSIKAVRDQLRQVGDLGAVAVAARTAQATMGRVAPLMLDQVFAALYNIATLKGQSSQTKKVDLIRGLCVRTKGNEAKYLIRSLEGKLRIGLAEQTVLVALAHATVGGAAAGAAAGVQSDPPPELKAAEVSIKSAYSQLPSYDRLLPAILRGGYADLPLRCPLTPGIPLKPMLAHPTKSLSEVLTRFETHRFVSEYKYDGERAQVHVTADGRVAIFSRNGETLSPKYPELVAKFPRWLAAGTTDLVLDAEVVAWDPVARKILPFQVLSTRKRKDVVEAEVAVQVVVYAFDCLYVNGRACLGDSLADRRAALQAAVAWEAGQIEMATGHEATDIEAIQEFLEKAVQDSTEGLMVKLLDGPLSAYEPSKRSRSWLKVKKDYLDGVGDTMDLVPLGGYYGRGKRTGVFGGFLLGTWDPASETYQSVCKIGTGFSEEDLATLSRDLETYRIGGPKPYYDLGDIAEPDAYFAPAHVWEVKAADLSMSPVYRAGAGLAESRGISLRFPRFLRRRDDKGPEQSTAPEQLLQFYQAQAVVGNGGNGGGADLDAFFDE